MTIVPGSPAVDGLSETVAVLRDWQDDGSVRRRRPLRSGPGAGTDGILAVGLLDGPKLLRLTIAPDAHHDEELAHRLVEDVTEPERAVLPEGQVNVEAPLGVLVRDLLSEAGWNADDPWTPLRRDLTKPVKHPGVRIEMIGPEQAHVRTGPGKRGLLESMGVHKEHRGSGYGKPITVAAAAHSRSSARRARSCAPQAPISAPPPPTSQPASSNSPRSGTFSGTPLARGLLSWICHTSR
ncbi:MAG TPA: hypothetical protein VFZ85_20515 [Jiangellaceae bacterium]